MCIPSDYKNSITMKQKKSFMADDDLVNFNRILKKAMKILVFSSQSSLERKIYCTKIILLCLYDLITFYDWTPRRRRRKFQKKKLLLGRHRKFIFCVFSENIFVCLLNSLLMGLKKIIWRNIASVFLVKK